MKTLLKTKRLQLYPLTDAQLCALAAQEPDPEMKQAYGDMLRGSQEHPAQRLWYTAWLITLRNGATLGDLCFKGPPKQGAVEIGYGLRQEAWGKGYATEAAEAAIAWAFSQPGVYDVTAETDPGNAASQRVLQKLGFQPDGKGAEGPRFRRQKPASNWMMIFFLFGLSIGLSLGAAMQKPGLSSSLGMCAGLALGSLLDSRERAARTEAHAARSDVPDA